MPIQIRDIEAYLNLAGVQYPATKLKYLRLIQQMDQVELKFLHEQSRSRSRD